MSDETQFVCPHCKQQIKHCAGMTFGEVMSLRHNKQHQDNLLDRLRAENEKLRAATGSLVRSLSGCWYAFEPSLRREMGNTNYHCVKEKMDEVEALLDFRAAAAALKEMGE